MTTSKIKIKMGQIEVEYEGSEAFLKQELTELLAAVSQLYKDAGPERIAPATEPVVHSRNGSPTSSLQGTTTTVAAKIGAASGSDLVFAAAARLTIVVGKASFSRDELLDEMKTATGYYKQTYRNNLSAYIQTLVKTGKLIETAKDVYSVAAGAAKEVESILAN